MSYFDSDDYGAVAIAVDAVVDIILTALFIVPISPWAFVISRC